MKAARCPPQPLQTTTHHLGILYLAETDKLQCLKGIPAEDESVSHSRRESRHSDLEIGRYLRPVFTF